MRFESSLVTNDSWCNGNTAVFGTAIQGSNPCESTKLKLNIMSEIIKVDESISWSTMTTFTKDLGLFQIKACVYAVVEKNSKDLYEHEVTDIDFQYFVGTSACKYAGFKKLYDDLFGENAYSIFNNKMWDEFTAAYYRTTKYKNNDEL